MVVAALGTFITGTNDASLVDKRLLAPSIRKYIRTADPIEKMPTKSCLNSNVIPEVDEESYTNEKESTL